MYTSIRHFLSFKYHNLFLSLLAHSANKKEYKVLGLKRSGNHAIINWIMAHTEFSTSFCNDLKPGQNPKRASIKKSTWRNFSQPQLIYSYEDYPVQEVFHTRPNSGTTPGKMESTLSHVLILRDPFNLMASRLAWNTQLGNRFRTDPSYRHEILNLWKNHAIEYLAISSQESSSKISINYNEWFSNKKYRLLLADQLDLDKNRHVPSVVANFGHGSSFDQLKFADNPEKMEVLNRWENFLNNPTFWELFQDKEVLDLSYKIFGPLNPYLQQRFYS